MNRKSYDVVIVGGGMAGLTSAAYLSKAGISTLLCEKEPEVGGLVNTFTYKGFSFDGGIRSMENSGIIFPMLAQLGIDVPFIKSKVSIHIQDKATSIQDKNSLENYTRFLCDLFPQDQEAVLRIIKEIQKVMDYMDILYGIDNPIFMEKNWPYLKETLLPWLFKFLRTIKKVEKLDTPIGLYLKKFTSNACLIDMITQHFFNETPAFFALSYFSLYTDYAYPLGGTGQLPQKMKDFILSKGGIIETNTQIETLHLEKRLIKTHNQDLISYKKLIWAADSKFLYNAIDLDTLSQPNLKNKIEAKKNALEPLEGGDSILTLYLMLDVSPETLKNHMTEHVFYTPKLKGLSDPDYVKLKNQLFKDHPYPSDTELITQWLEAYLDYTTYEISCPAMRDKTLAPEGKSGLIISCLFDYQLTHHLKTIGFYDTFKTLWENQVSHIIAHHYLNSLNPSIIDCFSSTPLTLEQFTGNTHGAITGWAFTNRPFPVVDKMSKVATSINTPLPHVYQAGQWTFSPSGLPISILTGKLAADKIIKKRI